VDATHSLLTVQLHNRLLLALLNNASSPISHTPLSASNVRKRKRVGIDNPEFDTDDTFIEQKARVQYWIKHFTHRERARLRKAIAEKAEEEDAEGEEVDAWDGGKKWSTYIPSQLVLLGGWFWLILHRLRIASSRSLRPTASFLTSAGASIVQDGAAV